MVRVARTQHPFAVAKVLFKVGKRLVRRNLRLKTNSEVVAAAKGFWVIGAKNACAGLEVLFEKW